MRPHGCKKYAKQIFPARNQRSIFLSARKENSFCALHTLSEVFSVLTGLPIGPRITGTEGVDISHQILARLRTVTLIEAEHFLAIGAASTSIVGGAIYDALIAACAEKAGAEVLPTWNLRDFTRLGSGKGILLGPPLEVKLDK